mmetsp:Transcript_69225/g.194115  ORF Transcript_69225/g.194115 Transcript_69225/m.194115 type:complete len:80 (-) Transcript_69225:57-296(-)
MLRLAQQRGTVVVVTKSEEGWVEGSCRDFLPTLAPMLQNMKVVSARATYNRDLRRDPLTWKTVAFRAEIDAHFGAEAYM